MGGLGALRERGVRWGGWIGGGGGHDWDCEAPVSDRRGSKTCWCETRRVGFASRVGTSGGLAFYRVVVRHVYDTIQYNYNPLTKQILTIAIFTLKGHRLLHLMLLELFWNNQSPIWAVDLASPHNFCASVSRLTLD